VDKVHSKYSDGVVLELDLQQWATKPKIGQILARIFFYTFISMPKNNTYIIESYVLLLLYCGKSCMC